MPDDTSDGSAPDPEPTADDSVAVADGPGAATDDLRVAAVAAACTVGLTLALRYGVGRDVAFSYRLLPLGPYFLSLFVDRLPLGGLDAPRSWSALTLAVTAALFVSLGVL